MLRHLSHAAILLFILILSSCSQSEKSKVVYLHPSVNRIRFVKDGEYMMERFRQLGVNAKMIDANDDETEQIIKGMKLVDEGIDMLIIVPVNGNTIAPLVRHAKEHNVKVIAYNRLINNTDYDFFITGHNVNNAEIFCQNTLKLKPTGNYVILNGDRFDRNGYELKLAIDSILKPHVDNGNIHILYESYVDLWNRDVAVLELEQVIQSWGTNIDAVIATGDAMATSVIELLKKYDMQGKTLVTGQNAEKSGVQNLINGFQCVDIYHPHQELGYKTAEVAVDILKGKDPDKIANSFKFNGYTQIPTLQIKSIAITKDNIQKELIDRGEYKASDFE